MELVIADDERWLVHTCYGPAGHNGSRGLNPGFPMLRVRTSGADESGGSWR